MDTATREEKEASPEDEESIDILHILKRASDLRLDLEKAEFHIPLKKGAYLLPLLIRITSLFV